MTVSTLAATARADPLAIGGGLEQIAVGVVVVLLVLLAVRIQFLRFRALTGSGEESTAAEQTNCPSCGARTSAEAQVCEYCGEPISG